MAREVQRGPEPVQGATVHTDYYDRRLQMVPVDMEDLKEFRSHSMQEFAQFVFAEFMFAGATWLGIERFLTIKQWQNDITFWVCAISAMSGAFIGFFAILQLRRRKSKIDRIIESASRNQITEDHQAPAARS